VPNPATRRDVIGGGKSGAGHAVEDGQEFWSIQHVTARVPIISSGVADDLALSIHGTIRSFADDFGFPITIQIINHELSVMSAFANISSKVDSPEERAIEFIRFEDGRVGHP